MPQEPSSAGGSVAEPEVSVEGGGSAAVPLDAREVGPSGQEQGAGLKWSRPDVAE